jgi:hypothetical protein
MCTACEERTRVLRELSRISDRLGFAPGAPEREATGALMEQTNIFELKEELDASSSPDAELGQELAR